MPDTRTSGDPERDDVGTDRSEPSAESDDAAGAERPMTDWLTSTTIRWMLALVGLVLLLFALGQAFDTPFLAWVVDAVTSEVGRWLVVALVAVALIAFATRAPWENWG